MDWTIEKAGQHFSELIRNAKEEPQAVFHCNRLVAAVIDPETFKLFQYWREQQKKRSLADKFSELRQLCIEEDYHLELPERSDRNNTFPGAADVLSL